MNSVARYSGGERKGVEGEGKGGGRGKRGKEGERGEREWGAAEKKRNGGWREKAAAQQH